MDNVLRAYEVFGDEYEKILEAWKKLPQVVRAERVIRMYLSVEHKTERLTKQFEEWLERNAFAALQTEALEDYFNFVVFGDIPATDPDRIKQAKLIVTAAAGLKRETILSDITERRRRVL